MADKQKTVRYELVPPFTSFQFTLPERQLEDGTRVSGVVERIGADGYETDDVEVIWELDSQNHAVQRVDASKK